MVQVTNAPEGRTYIDYRWDIREGAREYFKIDSIPYASSPFGYYTYSDSDLIEVQTPHIVSNGKWVMERPHGWAWLVGVQFEELEELPYADKDGVRHVLYSCDKPFGYVTALEGEYVPGQVHAVPVGRRYLVCAQQIHKGELGQTVPFNRIPYVRANDKKQGNGWIRLSDLMEASGLSSEEIIFGYWNHASGRVFDIVAASSPDRIRHQTPLVCSYTDTEMAQVLRDGKYVSASSPEQLWVRRGFAYAVLRLLALGVRPELHQFA